MLQAQGSSLPDATARAQALLYGTVQRQAGMLAFADVFFLMSILFIAVIPLMFFMKRSAPAAEIPAAH